MDLQEYYRNIRREEAELTVKHPDRVVYLTSLKNTSKNSLPGAVAIANPYQAARVIVDETHREATPEEVKAFLARQEENRIINARSEARKKKEIVVVMDRQSVSEELPDGSDDLIREAVATSRSNSKSSSRDEDDD